jgi:endoglucanase
VRRGEEGNYSGVMKRLFMLWIQVLPTAALAIGVPAAGAEGLDPVKVRVDCQKVLRPVPALRGIHMAPTEGAYQEEDVVRLKRLGATCLRFGFSGLLLEDEDAPGQYKEEGFRYLDRFVGWCEKHDVGAILDLHNVIGRRKGEDTRIWIWYFGSKDPKVYQDRFVNLWREIARRFAGREGVVAYELLNEPNPPHDDFEVWNSLAKRATAAIREVDRLTPIIVDSIGYAKPAKFKGLKPTGDARTIYSFHSYEPGQYHKQKRPWSFSADGETYYYPGFVKGKYWNRQQIREVFEAPVAFSREHGAELFCGEFGCVSNCPPMTDMIYLMDQISLFHELGIGWTMFNYMWRESKPYWKNHFDCNLFIYYIPEERLYCFTRKINFIRFFLEKEGEVLVIRQPKDEDVTCYGVREPDGRVSLLISNKDRQKDKKVWLELTGAGRSVTGAVSVMDIDSDDFGPAGKVDFEQGQMKLPLPKLSITRVDLTGGERVGGKTLETRAPQKEVHSGVKSQKVNQ